MVTYSCNKVTGGCAADPVDIAGNALTLTECQASCCIEGSTKIPEIGCVKNSYLMYGGIAAAIWYFVLRKPR